MPAISDSNIPLIDGGAILGVGTVTLDLVNQVEIYPVEDAEIRALGQWCA